VFKPQFNTKILYAFGFLKIDFFPLTLNLKPV
jgi:hypothetical protein